MTLTRSIIEIRTDWLRVPIWSTYFPLVLLPKFVLSAFTDGEWRRLLRSECWVFIFGVYVIGIDGWN